MKKHSREGVITHKFVEMMKLMNIYLNHFPKHEKQALCAQIRNTASMDAMGACIRQSAAVYQRRPEAHKRRLAA